MASKEIDFRKEYLPGYTGHVPKKMEIFGLTSGETNRIIVDHSRKISQGNMSMKEMEATALNLTNGRTVDHAKRTLYSNEPLKDIEGHVLQFGNTSRKGKNWIGGPTQNLKAQYIPGYQGFVPSIKAENIFGKSYAKNTATAVNKEFDGGFNIPTHQRYLSQNAKEHSKLNFRRIQFQAEPSNVRDMHHT